MIRPEVIQKFVSIVGKDRCKTSPEDLLTHSYDASILEFVPDAILFPVSTEEVSRIMALASAENVFVTPRGSASGLGGECLAKKGGILLSFTQMNKILEINTENRYAIVEPGIVIADFQKAVEAVNLFYPPDPGSATVASIGGAVMMNAGGMRGIKYGVTRDYLLGMEIVLPSGEVMKTGTITAKDVTGYDLTRLICGSEGTLAIATKITVRLLPKPKARRTLLAIYDDIDDAGKTVAKIVEAGIIPATMELMDKTVIKAVEEAFHLGLPLDAAALLLIDVDGDDATIERQSPLIAEFCQGQGARNVRTSSSEEENVQLWAARRAAFGCIARLRPTCLIEDATVPVNQMVKAIKKVKEICERNNVQIAVLAHAGDGNLHPLMLCDQRDKEEMARVEKAMDEFVEYAMTIGGTLSGEHGIGVNKAKYLPQQLSATSLKIQRGIKNVFDPQGILNPGSFLEVSPK
ncbi:MAG: putative FAD-linked oxidoreductase [Smithella sp. PtaU1.Bin162]|nr:MAG: putative FAD-linked oxidoreductase [Smithella sp. PtaU1.Bin162]